MEDFVSTVKSYYKEATSYIQFDTTEIKDAYNQFDTEVKKPFCKYYSTLHTDLTTVKKDYIFNNLSEGQRLAALGFLTLSTAYLSRRLLRRSFMSTLRITGVTYLSFGLFLYPEVFNPIFCIQGEKCNNNSCELKDTTPATAASVTPKSQ